MPKPPAARLIFAALAAAVSVAALAALGSGRLFALGLIGL